MSFVCERLNEEDEKYFRQFQFYYPFGGAKELARVPRNWVVDREKRYYLICLAGQGYTLNEEYPPYYYKLIINDKAIHIEARFGSEGNVESGITMTWRITNTIIPVDLKYIPKEEIDNIIKDALTVYGNNYKGGHVIATFFE